MIAHLGEDTELVDDRARGVGEIDLALHELDLPCVEPGEVEQVGREPRQTRHLRARLVEELPPLVGIELLVGHQLEEPAEREERRPQLVRRVGDELAAHAVEVGEAHAA